MTSTTAELRRLDGKVVGGRYLLHTFLGEGGFGVVYQATQVAFGRRLREVAIKIGKEPVADRDAAHAFADGFMAALVTDAAPEEIRQHFVAVYDAGCCSTGDPVPGHPYLTMEYVKRSLGSCLSAGPFPLTRAINAFDQMLKAVAFLHGTEMTDAEGRHAPILHRDLKPENVLVSRAPNGDDRLKISDFGLAVQVDRSRADAAGTLHYLAPECLTEPDYTPRSEVYTLALIFYELVTGRNPFADVGRDSAGAEPSYQERARQHLQARSAEAFRRLDDDPELRNRAGIRRVLRNALATDPGARVYKDAGELLAAWNRAKYEVGSAEPTPQRETPLDLVRRLTQQAEQYFALEREDQGWAHLNEAMRVNDDVKQVPDHLAAGETYLLAVRRLLLRDKKPEARVVASRGYWRRRCCSTAAAMALVQDDEGSKRAFEQEARQCPDRA